VPAILETPKSLASKEVQMEGSYNMKIRSVLVGFSLMLILMVPTLQAQVGTEGSIL